MNMLDRYMNKEPQGSSEIILFNLLEELSGRRGFSGWWFSIDSETQNEILESLLVIIKSGEE